MTVSKTFTANGQLQKYVVPPGVTSLLCELYGGQGGGSSLSSGAGGRGCYVRGLLAVTPGETLYLVVGKMGVTATGADGTGYGSNGGQSPGAYPGGEGGGQSIIFQGGIQRANTRAVAAGGGGAGGNSNGTLGAGGDGGYGTGQIGSNGDGSPVGGGGGAASSTSNTGGAAGTGGGTASAGGPDVGGRGAQGSGSGGSGGGGGAGWYGGGGGGAGVGLAARGGGGGGGSSFAGGLTSITNTPGARSGNGLIVLTIPNLPPYAPALLSPTNGQILDQSKVNRFSWRFGDPNVEDVQASYIFRVSAAGSGSWVEGAETATPNEYVDTAANSLGLGDFEWQVRTRDPGGLLGPYSPSGFFTVAAVPATPTITAPTVGQSIDTPTTTLSWTASAQTHYQWRRVADDGAGNPSSLVVYADSGEVAGAATRSTSLTFDTTGRTEHVQLRVKNSGLWSAWATVRVLVAFTPPAAYALGLIANNAAASITVTPIAVPPNLAASAAASGFEDGTTGGWIVGGSSPPTLSNVAVPTTDDTSSLIGQRRALRAAWQTGTTAATAIAAHTSFATLTAGVTYTATFWVRAAGSAALVGISGQSGTVTVPGDGYPRRAQVTFTATSSGPCTAAAWPAVAAAAGAYVDIDAVKIVAASSDAQPWSAPGAPAAATFDVYRRDVSTPPNLMPSDAAASFEDGSLGSWFGGASAPPTLVNIAADSGGVPSGGSRALRVVWATGSTSATAVARCATPIYLRAGTYTLTAWVRAAGTASYLLVYGLGFSVQATTSAFTTDAEWRRYSTTWTMPYDGFVVLQAAPSAAAVAGSFADIDAIQVAEGSSDTSRFHLPSSTTETRIATGVPAGNSYVDRTPASDVPYAYRVVAVAANGASSSSGWLT